MIRFGTLIVALSFSHIAGAAKEIAPVTFYEAKKIARKIHEENPTEFYCGCAYSGKTINLESCGYTPRKNSNRASRVEWEHIVPAWVIGHQRQCWQTGGRKNCSESDKTFQSAEADLHNLVPSIGELNGDRSNFGFGMITDQAYQYGQCQTFIDFKSRKIMPRKEVRGVVARTYLYMSNRYNLKLSKQDRNLFEVWNKKYPPDTWEIKRNQIIACITGQANPFISQVHQSSCKKSP